MQVENGKLVLGFRDCVCQDGTMPLKMKCRECNGTGKGKRGKVRGCKKCHGYCNEYSLTETMPCNTCLGNFKDFQKETYYDCLPQGFATNLRFEITRTNRGMSPLESLMGLGTCSTLIDYGTSFKKTDDKIIEDVVTSFGRPQACSVVDDEGNMPEFLLISVNQQGYTVKPVFKK